MRVIITGGTGLIGRALAADLARDGHEVVVLSRSPDSRGAALPAGVRVVGWDGRTAAGWGAEADGAGAIVNLAGEGIADGRWSAERKAGIRDSRVRAGAAVVEAIKAAATPPKMLLQASAVGYYGSPPAAGDAPLAESAPPGSDYLASVCVDWEASTAPVEVLGVRRVVTRTGVVLSMDGGALPKMVQPFKAFAGGPIGGGHQPLPWIHIADVVGAMRFLIDRAEASGPYNLSAPDPLTNAAFGQAIGHALGRPSAVPTPAFALKLAFGEMSIILLEGQRAVPERLLDLGYAFKFTDAETALRDLLGGD